MVLVRVACRVSMAVNLAGLSAHVARLTGSELLR